MWTANSLVAYTAQLASVMIIVVVLFPGIYSADPLINIETLDWQ